MSLQTSYPIILNTSNWVSGSTYVYNLGQSLDLGEWACAMQSTSVFFSWPNITSAQSNNEFSIIHPTSTTPVTLTFTIPDGGYSIDDLNNFLRFSLVKNGYYITNNSSGEQTVYAEFTLNPSTYQVNFISYPLPTVLPTGFTAGSAITFPASPEGPQLVVTQSAFGTLIGFALGTFPSSPPSSITTTGSTATPVVNPRTQVVLQLDSVWNPLASNSKVLYSFSIAGTSYGGLAVSEPKELSFVKMQSGYHSSLTITLCDDNLQPLNLLDKEVCIILVLKKLL